VYEATGASSGGNPVEGGVCSKKYYSELKYSWLFFQVADLASTRVSLVGLNKQFAAKLVYLTEFLHCD